MILTVVMVVIVGGMALTLFTVATSASKREVGRDVKFKSHEIAEAALDMAINELRKATDNADNDGNNVVDDGINAVTVFGRANPTTIEGQLGRIGTIGWTTAGDTVLANGRPDYNESGVVPAPFSGGDLFAYSVFSEADGRDNDGDGTVDEDDEAGAVMLFAYGRYRGIVSMVQWNGIFTDKLADPNPPMWDPNAAISVGGSLTCIGSADVLGAYGSVHANDHLDVGGSSTIAGNATACNGVNADPSKVGGTINQSAPPTQIPDLKIETYKSQADRVFAADGKVYDKNGNLLATDNYLGWNFTAGSWNPPKDGPGLTGVVYVEGDLHMAQGGNAWKATSDTEITLFVTGDVHLTAQGRYKPALGSLFVVSGGDIRINGQTQMNYPGIILAREQIWINGGADLKGVVMACDLDNAKGEVAENKINGNMTITYQDKIETDIPVITISYRFILNPTFAAYEER